MGKDLYRKKRREKRKLFVKEALNTMLKTCGLGYISNTQILNEAQIKTIKEIMDRTALRKFF